VRSAQKQVCAGRQSKRQDDARRLAELLRLDHLNPVYHGEHGLRTLKELVRSYLTITKDVARVKLRAKAIFKEPKLGPLGGNLIKLCSTFFE